MDFIESIERRNAISTVTSRAIYREIGHKGKDEKERNGCCLRLDISYLGTGSAQPGTAQNPPSQTSFHVTDRETQGTITLLMIPDSKKTGSEVSP